MTAAELIQRGAEHHRDRTAVIFNSERRTFEQINQGANRLAHALFALGLSKGERVAILLNNSIESLLVDFALLKSGLVRVPINTRLAPLEMTRMLEETESRLLLAGPPFVDRVRNISPATPLMKAVIGGAVDDPSPLIALDPIVAEMGDAEPGVSIDESDLATLQYTSGTTGVLKAAMHTQETWAAIAINILTNIPIEPDDIMLHCAPLTHAAGTLVLPHWIRGALNAILPGFHPQEFLQAVDRLQPTTLNLVPTMIAMLLAQPNLNKYSFESVRQIIYGAAPIPTETLRHGLSRWGQKFVQYYGQTESPLLLTMLAAEEHDLSTPAGQQHLLSSGRVLPTVQLKVVDDAGQPLPLGEIGELAVKSRQNMVGYWRAPDLTRATMTDDGWIRTRDLGYLDSDGYVYLVDRKSDMIITGGFNVYPREVEEVLYQHPAILEAAVIGIPDPTWGEAIKAIVVLREGQTATPEEIADWCRQRLAGYKQPRSVDFAASLPKSPVDKVLRRVLRDPYWPETRRI
ncbi:MAG: AMP-binding protein [Thermaerobacter sp.]|nr:AMP-binding protein [Thermaerobacter sp.]